jgi:hypothetical protein
MIWIESQDNNLFYCSAIKIKMVTNNQYLLINQNNDTLGEYFSTEDAKKILEKIKKIIKYRTSNIFSMPKKFEIPNE